MKNLFLALSVWLSLCCAGSGVAQAQGAGNQNAVPGCGAMVPSTGLQGEAMIPGGCAPGVPNSSGSSGPQPTGDILLVDAVSLILQTDGTSLICRAGGC